MNTKITLEHPYINDYIAGYLNTNKEPRRVVLLVRMDGTKTSTSYARYLMTCHLGSYIDKSIHVDHIDNDRMNDDISNYQLLTYKENIAKDRKITFITLKCPICNKAFSKDARNINYKIKMGKKPTCSRSCGGKMSYITKIRS